MATTCRRFAAVQRRGTEIAERRENYSLCPLCLCVFDSYRIPLMQRREAHIARTSWHLTWFPVPPVAA